MRWHCRGALGSGRDLLPWSTSTDSEKCSQVAIGEAKIAGVAAEAARQSPAGRSSLGCLFCRVGVKWGQCMQNRLRAMLLQPA